MPDLNPAGWGMLICVAVINVLTYFLLFRG
jgi:hypothetical protein